MRTEWQSESRPEAQILCNFPHSLRDHLTGARVSTAVRETGARHRNGLGPLAASIA